MNKVLLVGRLTRDPELRTLPSGKAVANLNVADYTNHHEHHRPPRRVSPPFLRRS
jgi:single-stranded DNA-binding protein